MGFDVGEHREAGNSGQAVATAATDTVFTVGEQEFILFDGDAAGGPVDLIADAVRDVIAFVFRLAHRAHLVRIEALVMGFDDGVDIHFLAHLFRCVDAAGDDGISITGPLHVEVGEG